MRVGRLASYVVLFSVIAFKTRHEYVGFPAPQNAKNCQNFQTSCPMLVKSVWFMQVIGLQKLLTFVRFGW